MVMRDIELRSKEGIIDIKLWWLCHRVFLLFLLSFSTNLNLIQASAVTTISLVPSPVISTVSKSFWVNVTAFEVLDLYGLELRLSWDPALISAVSATEGPFLQTGGDTFFAQKINNTVGNAVIDCTLLGNVEGVSGNGVLATINFQVENAGESVLDLYSTMLINSLEQQIPHEAIDGIGYFLPNADLAITGIVISPLIAFPDELVYINVTVQNNGGFTESSNVATYCGSTTIEAKEIVLDSQSATTVNFIWNTSNVEKGEYVISAEVLAIEGETNTENNFRSAEDTLFVLSYGHDIAIRRLFSKTVITQGYTSDIVALTMNVGNYTETFNVTIYINEIPIESQPATLESGSCSTLVFNLETIDLFLYQSYTISAYAQQVPFETDLTDNTFFADNFTIAHLGDINGDCKVDITDLAIVSGAFGAVRISNPQDLRFYQYWHPTVCAHCSHKSNADITEDGKIDIQDLARTSSQFGWFG